MDQDPIETKATWLAMKQRRHWFKHTLATMKATRHPFGQGSVQLENMGKRINEGIVPMDA